MVTEGAEVVVGEGYVVVEEVTAVRGEVEQGREEQLMELGVQQD